ncbi:hypothetical protein [Chryseobacterium sp. SIMBA_038]|uniref:hypothetical protein n=1 Tax=Chryseobacterium sp. SIMBA_038 TaxID=3085780 RepID=UPI00397B21F9
MLTIACNHKPLKDNIQSKQNVKECLLDGKNELMGYNFLYNNDYSIAINETRFWIFGKQENEFSYRKLPYSYELIQKSVKTFEKRDSLKEFHYKYAFVNNCKDTMYSDYSLKKWIVKVGGKPHFYEYNRSSQVKSDTLGVFGLRIYDVFFK